jgi:hypothetical protein
MLKKARLLTRPTLARRDAPCPKQGHSSEADPRFTFHASRFTILGSEARTKLADFFSILLGGPRPSVEKAHSKTSCCHACRKHHTDYPTRREAHFPRFTTPKFLTQIRHMGFRPEPFIF